MDSGRSAGLWGSIGASVLGCALLAGAGSVFAADVAGATSRGKVLFEKHCVVCHGVDGRADTPLAALLTPKPRNLADPVEMGRVSADRMYKSIKTGRPGTAMAGWGQVLSDVDIGDLVEFVHSLDTPSGSASLTGDRLSLEIGRRLYEKDCAQCHGADGKAETDFGKVLNPRPANFTDPVAMARLDDGRAYLAIFRGRPGTAMGGWGELLAPLEIIDLIRYVRSFAKPLADGSSAAQIDMRVGELVYRKYCRGCHGDDGSGRTELAQHLSPHPRDFSGTGAGNAADDQRMAQSIARGIPGTSMAPWDGVLNKEDIRRVLAYIHTAFGGGSTKPPPKK